MDRSENAGSLGGQLSPCGVAGAGAGLGLTAARERVRARARPTCGSSVSRERSTERSTRPFQPLPPAASVRSRPGSHPDRSRSRREERWGRRESRSREVRRGEGQQKPPGRRPGTTLPGRSPGPSDRWGRPRHKMFRSCPPPLPIVPPPTRLSPDPTRPTRPNLRSSGLVAWDFTPTRPATFDTGC